MSHALSDMLARREPGYSLERAFYTDPEIYERDLEATASAHGAALLNGVLDAVATADGHSQLDVVAC